MASPQNNKTVEPIGILVNKNSKNDDLPGTEKTHRLVSPSCPSSCDNKHKAFSEKFDKNPASSLSPSSESRCSSSSLMTKTDGENKEDAKILKSEQNHETINQNSVNHDDDDIVIVKFDKSIKKINDIIADANVSMELTPPVVPTKRSITPMPIIVSAPNAHPTKVAVPRYGSSRPSPANLHEPPIVLATHLVPSLPIELFEILAEVIEAATDKPVILLHESRVDRPVAKNLVDIAILPASENWDDGTLLPVSFVFEHRLNKDKSPAVYVDIVVAQDCARNIEEIVDLRGYRCALPDRRKALGGASVLFNYLKSKGENPSFFGNTLDPHSQLAALQMVAGKQADVSVLESSVINCHKNTLPGVESLFVLASLGPLPPYRIMINKKFQASFVDKIKENLLNIESDDSWIERLRSFGVAGFAEYNENLYDLENVKSVATSVPYY